MLELYTEDDDMYDGNDFEWNWANFLGYGLIWLMVGCVYNHFTAPLTFSREDLECIYEGLREDPVLTREQEQKVQHLCGSDPCGNFVGCALNESQNDACSGFDNCWKTEENKKYMECRDAFVDTMVVPVSVIIDMPDKDFRQRLRACTEEE